jgi:SLA1 homology domain 1, SHD1
MSRIRSPLQWLLTLGALEILTASAGGADTLEREWRDTEGRTIAASLLGIERGAVVLRLANGKRTAVELEKLSSADRAWIDQWRAGRSFEQILPPSAWPAVVTQPLPRIEGPSQDGAEFVFRTAHYRFIGDAELSMAAMQDFATVAEATWKLLETWPLAISRTADPPLIARIFRDRAGYEAAGGLPQTAGFFRQGFGRQGALLVPFESLGIEAFHGRFTKGAHYHPRVLIHEMTHQIYAPLIALFPLWLNEGIAENAALLPYQNGSFRLDRDSLRQALRQRLDDYHRRDPGTTGAFGSKDATPETWTMPLDQLFDLDQTDPSLGRATLLEKHRAYFTSLLVVFHLLHFDGDGEARRLRACIQQVAELRFGPRRFERRPPDGWSDEDIASRDNIREKVTSLLLAGRAPAALQAEMLKRFGDFGVKLGFPTAP